MALSNPLDLFAEFELLNFPGVLDTGGQWTIESAPAFPFDMCTDCGGGYTDVPYTAAGQDVCTGIHDPLLDMEGALGACASGNIADGVYVFKYAVSGGSCPSESLFTVNIVDGVITVDIVRVPDVCLIEMYTENPDTPGSKEANFTSPATNQLNPPFELRYKVVRKELDGCSESITDLYNTVEVWPGFVPGDLGKDPGEAEPLTHPVDGIMEGLFLAIEYRIQMGGWDTGGYIDTLKFYPGPINVDCTGAVLASTLEIAKHNFAADLRDELGNQFITVHGLSSSEIAFDTVYEAGVDELVIWAVCCNQFSGWYGINKNDWEVVYYPDAITIQIDNDTTSDFTTVGFRVIDQMDKYREYDVLNCRYYTTDSTCTVGVIPLFCTEDYSTIFDFPGSNYNDLDIIAGTKCDVIDSDYVCPNL